MGTGILSRPKKTQIIYKSSLRIEFTAPDNQKAEIGEYIFASQGLKETSLNETWSKLLGNYKSSKPIEDLLKDTKNCRALTSYIRQGIPVKWRWQTWKSYINLVIISEKRYRNIPLDRQMIDSVIIKDVHRTFPEHKYFDKKFFGYYGQYALLRVLAKFSSAYPDVGYCQGMNFVVGFMLIVSGGNEIECFCMLEAIIYHFNIGKFFSEGMPELKKALGDFDINFQKSMNTLYWHFKDNEVYEDMWILKWFITLFTAVLPLKVVLNIWDILMVDGISILPQAALCLLKYFEQDLLVKDGAEILYFFNSLKDKSLNPSLLLSSLYRGRKRTKTKAEAKIVPFTHPRASSHAEDPRTQPEEPLPNPSIFRPFPINHCEIIENPEDLPFAKPNLLLRKNSKINYKNSLSLDDCYESSTLIETKNEETFDAHVILNDLITEDFD